MTRARLQHRRRCVVATLLRVESWSHGAATWTCPALPLRAPRALFDRQNHTFRLCVVRTTSCSSDSACACDAVVALCASPNVHALKAVAARLHLLAVCMAKKSLRTCVRRTQRAQARPLSCAPTCAARRVARAHCAKHAHTHCIAVSKAGACGAPAHYATRLFAKQLQLLVNLARAAPVCRAH